LAKLRLDGLGASERGAEAAAFAAESSKNVVVNKTGKQRETTWGEGMALVSRSHGREHRPRKDTITLEGSQTTE